VKSALWKALLGAAVVVGALLPGTLLAAPAKIEDTLAARLAACSTCHGAQGRAAPDGYHPRIAGKPSGYVYNQLLNFREGRRAYGPMVGLVAPLSDAYLREIAQHYAALQLPYAAPPPARADAATLARGQRLALQGDAARQLPACSSCHGPTLTGRLPATPGLLGLPRDYLIGQLGAWRNGQRRAHAPDCMADIARQLSPEDLGAVTAWLASQAVPVGAGVASAPGPGETLPMKCGSAVAP
jgi:cytochrome c553